MRFLAAVGMLLGSASFAFAQQPFHEIEYGRSVTANFDASSERDASGAPYAMYLFNGDSATRVVVKVEATTFTPVLAIYRASDGHQLAVAAGDSNTTATVILPDDDVYMLAISSLDHIEEASYKVLMDFDLLDAERRQFLERYEHAKSSANAGRYDEAVTDLTTARESLYGKSTGWLQYRLVHALFYAGHYRAAQKELARFFSLYEGREDPALFSEAIDVVLPGDARSLTQLRSRIDAEVANDTEGKRDRAARRASALQTINRILAASNGVYFTTVRAELSDGKQVEDPSTTTVTYGTMTYDPSSDRYSLNYREHIRSYGTTHGHLGSPTEWTNDQAPVIGFADLKGVNFRDLLTEEGASIFAPARLDPSRSSPMLKEIYLQFSTTLGTLYLNIGSADMQALAAAFNQLRDIDKANAGN